ncbi:MAG: hypothetical protein Q4G26_11230, partial [Paracoccus sp. (in: a-proteobacteria)]|nr:hypothetical protein [Paracoccus sp. (in: a-proteobacteria)]
MFRAAFGLAGGQGVRAAAQRIPDTMPIRLTTEDLSMMRLWRREQFLDRVEKALTEEYFIEHPESLRREIRASYDIALERGYRIEAASYLFIRASYVLGL